jgi:hypothetical protein
MIKYPWEEMFWKTWYLLSWTINLYKNGFRRWTILPGVYFIQNIREFGIETYLMKLNSYDRAMIAKLRCSNIKFPIETGRWNGVPKHERICNFFGNGIGDAFHYLFICEKQEIKSIREKFIPIYCTKYPTELKLSRMFMYCHEELYRYLASFLKIIVRFFIESQISFLYVIYSLFCDVVLHIWYLYRMWICYVRLYTCVYEFV